MLNCDQNKKGLVSFLLETKGISLDDTKEMCIPKVFENTSSVSYNYHLNNGRETMMQFMGWMVIPFSIKCIFPNVQK